MTLTPREASDASGSEQIGVLHVDPAGERAPAVRLMDGTDLGPLDNVLSRFTVKDLSEEETEVLRLWEKSHEMAARAAHLEKRVAQVEQEMSILRHECEEFLEQATQLGFRLERVPRFPGMPWDRNITAERWHWLDPGRRAEIVRGLLIGIDWRVKAREWNFDPFEVTVLDREGSTLACQGPIARRLSRADRLEVPDAVAIFDWGHCHVTVP